MKKLFGLLVTIAVCIFAADVSAQSYLPTITSTGCIGNGAGDAITAGQLIIVGTDQNDNPIPYRVNGSAQATTGPITRTITNGALVGSLQLANPALTSPVGVLYRIAVKDSSTAKITVYKQVIIAANSGSNFDICLMNTGPSFAPVTVITNPGTVNGNTVQNGDLTVNGRFISTQQTITFSATPTFDCSSVAGGSFFKLTLTANVTSSTLSNCNTGQRIIMELCQDATGSRTFVPPTNIQSFVTIPSTASSCTAQFFVFDNGISKAIPDSTTVVFITNGTMTFQTASGTLPAIVQNDGGGDIQVGTSASSPSLTIGPNPFSAFSINPGTALVSAPTAGQARRGMTYANDPAGDVTFWYSSAQTGAGIFFKDSNGGAVMAVPTGAGSLVSRTTTDTLTNKTLTSPVVTNPSTTGTDSGTETMSSKRIQPRAVALTTATTFTPTSDTADINTMSMTGVTGTLTIAAPTGAPTDGQSLKIRITSTNSQTYSFNAVYHFSTSVVAPTTIAATKTDYIGCLWNATNSAWDVVAVDQGH